MNYTKLIFSYTLLLLNASFELLFLKSPLNH